MPLWNRAVITLLLVTTFLFGCTEAEQQARPPVIQPVKVHQISGFETGSFRSAPGTVVADTAVDLAFRVPGQLMEFPVSEGQQLAQGSLVARLDPKDYENKLHELQSKLKGAEAALSEASLNYARSQELIKTGAISKSNLDTALTQQQNAASNLASLQQQIVQAKQDLDYTTLYAPFSGVIAQKLVKNFQTVSAQESIARLENIADINIKVELPEAIFVLAMASLSKDPEAPAPVATFAALPGERFELNLKEYETKANPQTQTYTITFTMPQPKNVVIHPGMTAEVTGYLPSGTDKNLLLIPAGAVFSSDGKTWAWILDPQGMTVAKREVKAGELTGNQITIREGLNPGDTIVTAGVHSLQEGQQVRILEGKVGGGV